METEIVEVFACPQCAGENYVVWGRKESSRSIACGHHYGEIQIPGKNPRGFLGGIFRGRPAESAAAESTPTLVVPEGFYFLVERGKGLRGVERVREEGKSWVEGKAIVIGKAEV